MPKTIKKPFTQHVYKQAQTVVKIDKEEDINCYRHVILPAARSKLRKYGWKTKSAGCSASTCSIFVSKCGKFVLKKHYLPSRSRPPIAYLIPTITFAQDKGSGSWRWALQPKVSRDQKSLALAHTELSKVDKLENFDLKKSNIGLWKNKPVFFDW